MTGQTPEQNYERIKKIYKVLGRDMPDEWRTMLQSVKITIELSREGLLEFTSQEDLIPIYESGVDAQ